MKEVIKEEKPAKKEAKAKEVKEEVKKEEKTSKKETKKVEKKEEKVDLSTKTVAELKEMAKEKGIEGYTKLKKAELIEVLNK